MWKDEYKAHMLALPDGMRGIGETFHVAMFANGLSQPDHHNALSANFHSMVRLGHLVPTGEREQMIKKSSNGRGHCPVYRLVKNPVQS